MSNSKVVGENHFIWPTLYKMAKKGKVQCWLVETKNNVITVTHGQVDGKKQSKDTTCKGKNQGKVNATSDISQAQSEAQSKWEKQLKKGYTEDPSGEVLVSLPQKVSIYQDHKRKVSLPCFVEPKLNGVNSTFVEEGSPSYEHKTRGGEYYPQPCDNAVSELEDIRKTFELDELNCETYLHGEHLQDIQSAVKKPTGEQGKRIHDKLIHYIFEVPNFEGTWAEHHDLLSQIDEYIDLMNFKNVATTFSMSDSNVTSHEEIDQLLENYLSEGFEGAIIRNYKGVYKHNERSNDVFKYKIDMDAEFLIVDYKVDKNGQPVFLCKCEGGEFWVKPKGTKEERAKILEEIDDWVGNYVTVEFEMYSKDMKPLKPKATTLRKGYEDETGKFIPTE